MKICAALVIIVLTGCTAAVKPAGSPSAIAPQSTAAPASAPAAAVRAPAPAAAAAPAPAPSAKPQDAGRAETPAAKKPVAASTAPRPEVAHAAAAAPHPEAPAAKPEGPAPLDLKILEQQLKETKAIGLMTKLSLKNQVDDLLAQFRAYYQGQLKASLADLRRPYELLLMKVLAVLQDGDPALAHAINASREAIWGILSDRDKFARATT